MFDSYHPGRRSQHTGMWHEYNLQAPENRKNQGYANRQGLENSQKSRSRVHRSRITDESRRLAVKMERDYYYGQI